MNTLQRNLSVVNAAPGAVITTLHFLHNLRLDQYVNVFVINKTIQLIRPIHKLRKKWSAVNAAPGAVFTTLHFLHNLRLDQYIEVFVICKPFKCILTKQSSLFGPFISYEENEVLWMQPQGLYSLYFIFFITYDWTNTSKCLSFASLSNVF
jgi:hypothetical protein